MVFIILLTIFTKQVVAAYLVAPDKMLINTYSLGFEVSYTLLTWPTLPPDDKITIQHTPLILMASIIITMVITLAIMFLAYRKQRLKSSVLIAVFAVHPVLKSVATDIFVEISNIQNNNGTLYYDQNISY